MPTSPSQILWEGHARLKNYSSVSVNHSPNYVCTWAYYWYSFVDTRELVYHLARSHLFCWIQPTHWATRPWVFLCHEHDDSEPFAEHAAEVPTHARDQEDQDTATPPATILLLVSCPSPSFCCSHLHAIEDEGLLPVKAPISNFWWVSPSPQVKEGYEYWCAPLISVPLIKHSFCAFFDAFRTRFFFFFIYTDTFHGYKMHLCPWNSCASLGVLFIVNLCSYPPAVAGQNSI